jgi:hypothetical protein
MYIRNRKGLNTDPWGTPASIPSHPDENPGGGKKKNLIQSFCHIT